MPAICLSTASYFPNTELGFRMAAELGYDGVEVMVNHDRRSQSVESVHELSSTYSMPIRSVHVPCLVITQHVWGWNPITKLRRSVDMAAAVDAEIVVVHPPFRWQREYGDEFVALVSELNAGAGPIVTVENMYTVVAPGNRKVDPYLWNDDPSFAAFGALTLDTSHAGAARQDVVDLYGLMGDRVRHLHLSDSTSTKGDEHLPPGLGTLPLDDLAGAMHRGGFDGHVVLEVGIGKLPGGTRTAAARDCREWAEAHFPPTS